MRLRRDDIVFVRLKFKKRRFQMNEHDRMAAVITPDEKNAVKSDAVTVTERIRGRYCGGANGPR
ncbi:MAG: hypothetical protein JO227_24555 [Acetobacteraceae bacterium]|nr:hypothetical protein [Acetobacteraceae bacterium]